MTKFEKFRENLRYDEATGNVYSYDTLVAKKDGLYLIELGYWSLTTRKHVNYVAAELGLTVRQYQKK